MTTKQVDQKERFRFKFDPIISTQIDPKHDGLKFESYRDAYNYAVETWGSDVANNYITIQEFVNGKWK